MESSGKSAGRLRASIAGAMILAAALGVITYAKAINNHFVYDDYAFIVGNPLVEESGPWYRFWKEPYWPRGLSPDRLYRPLTIWSYRATVVLASHGKLDKDNARPFHIGNLVLHALTSMGVALLAWRVARRPWAAWLAGALFATHPLHTEAVVTGYGRSELLAAVFTVFLMARYINPGKDLGFRDGESKGASFHVVNGLLLLLAMMSKEHAIFVWPILLLYDVWRYRHTDKATKPDLGHWLHDVAVPAHAGFMLVAAAFFFLRFQVFGWLPEFAGNPVTNTPLIVHVLTPFRLLWLTMKLVVWPAGLCPIWSAPHLSLPEELAPDVLGGMFVMSLLIGMAILTWRRGSVLGVITAGLLVLLVMPIHAIPMANWLYAERWLYLPSVLIAVLVGVGLARVPVLGWGLGLAVAIIMLPASWQYGSKYKDGLTMMSEVVHRQPDNFDGWRYLIVIRYLSGDYEGAIQTAQDSIERFGPSYAGTYDILIRCYLALGKGREALDAIGTYEWLRRNYYSGPRVEDRQRAEALIAQQAAASRPSTGPTAASQPGG